MFKKKPRKDSGEYMSCDDELKPHKTPLVFLFDCEEGVAEGLRDLRINIHRGSFGEIIQVNNKAHEQKFINLNYDFPLNLHEFDVVVLDLTNDKTKDYDPRQHQLGNVSGNTAHALLSAYPEQIFDPRPLSIKIASRYLNELSEKKSIIIAFCGSEKRSEYQFVEITGRGADITSREKVSNFDFYQEFPGCKFRHGVKVNLPKEEPALSPLFLKHLDDIVFETVFYHPTVWQDGKNQKSKNFIPLLLNERGEIVSYAHFVRKTIVLVFPDIKNKPGFVSELFKTYLPEIAPEIFPFHGEFKWLDGGDYPLPGESQLRLNRGEIEEKYKKDVAANDEALARLKEAYRFLTDLISETGEPLVAAVAHYLKWLGFESVINLDDTEPELLEEDIQIDCGNRFLVIEIKGLGGTSTDKDCAQISKIKYRRAEQRGKFDVYGLYVVNHQRYMPPRLRSNPPFTTAQIKDAELDKRGLLTTYELYNAYFLIEEGVVTKAEVQEAIFKMGLIRIEPTGLVKLGNVNELYMDGRVVILNLPSVTVSIGDVLLIKKQENFLKAIIESLQVNGKEVKSCSGGEVGIRLSISIKKNSEVFFKEV